MKRVTALLTVLSVCACLIGGCAANTAQSNEHVNPDASQAVETESDASQTVETEPDASQTVETESDASQTEDTQEPVELIVFAAASMTETMEQIAQNYKEVAPNVRLVYNFDSSGTLKTQIEEGADCDIFISAANKQMDQLDITADKEVNKDGLDYVDESTRIKLLENKVALAVPEGNPKNIKSYDDLVAGLKDGSVLLAMGNEDVPVGQYTQKIFAYYDLDEDKMNKDGVLTYGSNVKEVTTQVSEGAVDCGIIYSTDAFSAGLTVVDTATKEMCGQVIYPAAVLKISKHPEEAGEFMKYLESDESKEVFEGVGFTCVFE
ncbi:MAG: molybdate ABC transporter substrate-binding protein [Lachnospiraceae bacterium]|nr:molybdate ABC transporter substrate-binding protein [Lachnospiraceae bacterium]